MKKASRKRARRARRKKDSPLWQWLLVTIIALVLYYALDVYLGSRNSNQGSDINATQETKKSSQENTIVQDKGVEWTLERAEGFLPEEADPDHFEVIPLLPGNNALLSYGIPLPDKEADPQGLTNTRPGLSLIRWTGEEYKSQPLLMPALEPALGKGLLKQLIGRPQVNSPLAKEEFFLIPVRLFLEPEDREVMAYLYVDDLEIKWAPLVHASGKKMPAAFWVGTTEKVSRKIRHRKRDQPYLIIEHGILDEWKPYEGFQWKVQAYRWDQVVFRYDSEYSKELTKKKLAKS